MTPFDRIVLLGFGGPENSSDIRPFLDRVLTGRNVPRERYEEVVQHYQDIGGKSPFNELTRRQAEALQTLLRERGVFIEVETAYLYAAPFAREIASRIDENAESVLGIILSAFQSPASWQRYQILPNARYIPPYGEHPMFVEAYAERVSEALSKLDRPDFSGVELVMTAHSIPQSMAGVSPYAAQFARSAAEIARIAGAPSWTIAYQSRSGSPADPWLGPDVRDVIAALPQRGVREAVVAPIGFLCDHVEVLYDLDIDAARRARECGVRMTRARALNDHPMFIRMLADLSLECAASPS